MLETQRKIHHFKIKDIWWADEPYDVDNCDGVTFYACKNKVDIQGFSRDEFATLIVDLTEPMDTIWKNISKSFRTDINHSKKAGVEIKINQRYEDFFELYQEFKKNKGLPPSYEDIDFMKNYGTLFIYEFEDEILGGVFALVDKDHLRLLSGGSKRLEVDKKKATLIGKANRLNIWHAINYAKEKNIKEFDLGGYYVGKEEDTQKTNINFFKDGFGGKLTTQYIYRKHYSKTYHLLRSLHDSLIG